MTEKQTAYFCKAYELKNIASAANELYVSRPVVSRAILTLEEEVKADLFIRNKEGIIPTEAGNILYNTLKGCESYISNAIERIHSIGATDNNMHLSLCFTPTNIVYITENILFGFTECYPNIKIEIIEVPAGEMLRLLYDKKIDFAFTPSKDPLSVVLNSVDIYQAKIIAAVNKANSLANKEEVSIMDLINLPLATLSAPMPMEKFLDSICTSMNKKLNIVVRTSRTEVLHEIMKKENIIALIPDDFISHWDDITGIPIDCFPSSTHRMIWDSKGNHNIAFTLFLNYVIDTLNSTTTDGTD